MSKKKSDIIILFINLIVGLITATLTAIFLNKMEWFALVLAYGSTTIFTIGTFLFYFLKKQSLYKSFFSLNITASIIILCFVLLSVFGVFESFKDSEKVKQIILDSGNLGVIIFFLIVVFQVVILPAPAFIFYIAGTAIFGAFKTFLISYLGVIVGSVIAFFLGRLLGKKVVYWCIGKEKTEKYSKMLGSKGYVLFSIMQILPFFPDDILCMVAGLSNMKFLIFFIIILVVRPIYILAVCFFGTGEIIPFSGYGILIWIAIFLVMGLLFYLYSKNQQKIEKWFNKKFVK